MFYGGFGGFLLVGWFVVGFFGLFGFFCLQDWLLGFKYSLSVAYFCICVLLSLFTIFII